MNIDIDIIIGAGITGLSYAYFSKRNFMVFEKEKQVGGLCKSVKDSSFTFDYSGHFIHIKDKKIKKFIEDILGKKLLTVTRNSVIYFKDKIIPFPFQANLYYLSDKEKKECVEGIKNRKNIKIYNDMPFIDWCNAMFGKGITKYFMAPYNQKLWNCNLKKMTAAWTAPFVPKPSVESIEKSAYQKNNNSYGYNSCFYYPQTGGCGIVAESLYKKVKKSVKTGLKVTKIDYIDKCVYADGIWYGYTNLISTQPLKELLKSIINLPKRIKKLTNNLKFTSVRCINLGIKYKKSIPEIIKGKHWIYIPNKKYPFYRVGVYSNVCPKSAPKNCYSLYVEFSGKNNVYDNCEDTIQYLKDLKIINSDDEIVTANVVDMPYAYVVFNKERQKTLEKINEFLIKNNIYSIGRYGGWEYSFIEKNISDAKKLAEFIGKKK